MVERRSGVTERLGFLVRQLHSIKKATESPANLSLVLQIFAEKLLDASSVANVRGFVLQHLADPRPLFINIMGLRHGDSVINLANTKGGSWRNLGNQATLTLPQVEAYAIWYARVNKLPVPAPVFLSPDVHAKVASADLNQRLIDQVWGLPAVKVAAPATAGR